MSGEYYEINGTSYDTRTPTAVCNALECCRSTGTRARIYYGDTVTGVCWMDEYDTMGYIGRSMGAIKIPLLIASKCSMGGQIYANCKDSAQARRLASFLLGKRNTKGGAA